LTVINAGVSGGDSVYSYMHLKRRMIEYHPDLIILGFNSTDVGDIMVRGGLERFGPDGLITFRSGPWWEWIYASSYSVRHLVHDVLRHERHILSSRKVLLEEENRAFEKIHAVVAKCNELAQEIEARFLLAYHPLTGEVQRARLDFQEFFETLRKETTVPTLDVLDCFLNSVGMSKHNVWDYYWKIDRHHNARGYAALAQCVAGHLIESGWVARTR
jgi:hypothetical protein